MGFIEISDNQLGLIIIGLVILFFYCFFKMNGNKGGKFMKKWYLVVAALLVCGIIYASEMMKKPHYFSKREILNAGEKIVILKNATVDETGKIFTVSTTNNVIHSYTVLANDTYYATIIVGGDIK